MGGSGRRFESKVEKVGVVNARPAILERPALAEQRIGADEAMRKAERFLNRHLGHLLAAGTPQRVPFPLPPTWIVPGIHLGAKKKLKPPSTQMRQIVPKHYNEFRKKRIENRKFVPFLIRCCVVWRPHPWPGSPSRNPTISR
jgi:hypothetical protein